MIEDTIKAEISYLKSEVESLIGALKSIASQKNRIINSGDENFFAYIAKHIIFFKNLYLYSEKRYQYKVMISDLYFYMLSLITNEVRYVYVNERSIIENYTRILMNTTTKENHVTEKMFVQMKEKYNISEDDYSLIKCEYKTSCGYFHGGNILEQNLVFVFKKCLNIDKGIEKRNLYYERVIKVIKIYDKLLISNSFNQIDGVFYRRKSILKYLLGSKNLEYLFSKLNRDT